MNADQQPKNELIEKASALIKAARHVVVFTGAGISTPSGIPDFRSAGTGLWQKVDPMRVASLTAFRQRPADFYDWLRPLAATTRAANPNPAHLALAQLEQQGVVKAVITQNIDGLHQAAGSQKVLEVHGSMTHLTCPRCGSRYPAGDFIDRFVDQGTFPRCPADQSNLKPDIVLFEEMLPEQTWTESEWECSSADLMFVIGSSLEVGPANMLPVYAVQNGARLIINTRSSTFLDSRADVLLPYEIAEVVPAIAERVLAG